MAGLAEDYAKFTNAGARIIAISVDNREKSRELAEKLKLPFPVLSDTDHKIIDSYDLYNSEGKIAKPAVFVVDKKGFVRWRFLDEDYRVRPLNNAVLAELEKIK